MPAPLCHFEFMSDDPEKCMAFYAEVLGWEYDACAMPGYTFIKTAQPAQPPCGGLMKRPDEAPAPALNVYFQVDDIDATLEKVKAAGGTVVVMQKFDAARALA